MKLGTRLLLAFLPAVTVVMAVYAWWALEQREETLVEQARSETRAYAAAVGLAFEHAFRDLQFRDVQQILNEVGRQPKIYGVIVYDTAGSPTIVSEGIRVEDAIDPGRVRGVVRSGTSLDLDRKLQDEDVFTVLRPIRDRGSRVTGVLEVLQPLSFVEAEKVRTAQRFLLNTLTLLAVLAGLTVWLLRRLLDRPLGRLVAGIRTVGAGELSHRVPEEPAGSELAELGGEFNRMAARLEEAREALLRETEGRLALEQRVREKEKLASLGTLAAGVAHQIAPPLNVIDGRARLLLDREGSREERERALRTIVEQTERITRLVRSLVEFGRRPEPRVRPVELGSVIREAARRLELDLSEAGVTLALPDGTGPRVSGDPDLLQEVMLILLGNALDAAREGTGERGIEVRTGADGAEAWVEVADSGPGIAGDARPRVFEAFFTTKAGGTGLGLAIARSVVERLGGAIAVGTRPEGGAAFRFTLPLTEASAPGGGPDG